MKSIVRLLPILLISIIAFGSCQNEVAQIINAATHAVPVANAGPSKTIQLPVNADTLVGTASSANGPITGYLWSLVSGPNVPVIASPSSRITAINNLIVGNYIFQFTVIDSAGYTGVDTLTIKVIPSNVLPQQTVVLQPSNNADEFNFALLGGANASSHIIELVAASWTNGGVPLTVRGAFKFNLSNIPLNATLVSAKLSLYSNPTPLNGPGTGVSNSGTNNSMWIRRLTSNWTTSTPWASQPVADSSTEISISHTTLPVFDLIDINVKPMVEAMRTNGNYGFIIRLQNEVIYNIRNFASSIHPDATKHPKLVLVYQ
jgi:hypothetical protein